MDKDLFERLDAGLLRGESIALALVMSARGSTPRGAGAAMLAGPRGRIAGTVGGGAVEAEALRRMAPLAERGGCEFLSLDLAGTELLGESPICGGAVELLLWDAKPAAACEIARAALDKSAAAVLVFSAARDASTAGQGGPFSGQAPLAAVLDARAFPLWKAEGIQESLVARAAEMWSQADEKTFVREGFFFDCVTRPERLLILGGGHVGSAVALIAGQIGFEVTVADFRPEFSRAENFAPGTRTMEAGFAEAVERFDPGPEDYALVVSPGHQDDAEAIRALLKKSLRYIGAIGSRRKTGMILERLRAELFDPQKIDELCMPVGLDIGAETPQEIAVAIAAELIMYRRMPQARDQLRRERELRRAKPYAVSRPEPGL